MQRFAVIDTETTWTDKVMSIGVVIADTNTKEVVGIYGSMREYVRCIKNLDIGFISSIIKKDFYKPRTRKYAYLYSSEEEFLSNPNLQNAKLCESEKIDKKPKVFEMTNDTIGYSKVFDNQVQASKICGIGQADISHLIKENGERDGWRE